MEKIIDSEEYAVERAVLNDAIGFENGRVIVSDDRAAIVQVGNWYKCLFRDVCDYFEYAKKYELSGNVCFIGAPLDTPSIVGFEAGACVTFAYFEPLPPELGCPANVTVKRLAPTLAQYVAEKYVNPGGGYTAERMAGIMRTKGVFGAITDGKLAGFIGRHGDGTMGMLTVFPEFRRRGLGGMLERFMMGYVMTFGRTPICDVHLENDASLRLQRSLGMTRSSGYSFWTDLLSFE